MGAVTDIGCSCDSTRNTLGAFEAVSAGGVDVVPLIAVANPEAGESTRERRTITRGWLESILVCGGTENAISAATRAALCATGAAVWVSNPGGAAATETIGESGERGDLAACEPAVEKDGRDLWPISN
jgi:hypothetical protein